MQCVEPFTVRRGKIKEDVPWTRAGKWAIYSLQSGSMNSDRQQGGLNNLCGLRKAGLPRADSPLRAGGQALQESQRVPSSQMTRNSSSIYRSDRPARLEDLQRSARHPLDIPKIRISAELDCR